MARPPPPASELKSILEKVLGRELEHDPPKPGFPRAQRSDPDGLSAAELLGVLTKIKGMGELGRLNGPPHLARDQPFKRELYIPALAKALSEASHIVTPEDPLRRALLPTKTGQAERLLASVWLFEAFRGVPDEALEPFLRDVMTFDVAQVGLLGLWLHLRVLLDRVLWSTRTATAIEKLGPCARLFDISKLRRLDEEPWALPIEAARREMLSELTPDDVDMVTDLVDFDRQHLRQPNIAEIRAMWKATRMTPEVKRGLKRIEAKRSSKANPTALLIPMAHLVGIWAPAGTTRREFVQRVAILKVQHEAPTGLSPVQFDRALEAAIHAMETKLQPAFVDRYARGLRALRSLPVFPLLTERVPIVDAFAALSA